MKREQIINTLKHLEEKLQEKEIIPFPDGTDKYYCPLCKQVFSGEDIINFSYKWCYSCGQRLDFTLPRNKIHR